ncbi:Gaa1-like protein [Limtongia smithiae]|uniref:Gaa1-like protein n=1 Tax=Limtongia smithiae TaxID=1125753 RepID=UPI0034CFA212
MSLITTYCRRLFLNYGANVYVLFLQWLPFLLVVAGIGWLCVLPMEGQSRRTYISENALLPGQALNYFQGSEENIVRAYREEMRLLANASEYERSREMQQWIADAGYKSAIHNWTFSHGADDIKSGANVYGVLRAPRGDTTESMILCAPFLNRDGVTNEGGIAIAIALARYFARWSVWSKDIILLIPSDTSFGLTRWVEDYHYSSMTVPSGLIQGGIVLDFPGSGGRFEKLEILYEGMNGQLPNLDLINTLVVICGHMGIKVVVQNIDSDEDNYHNRAMTLFSGLSHQAFSGLHSPGAGNEVLTSWRIDAITLAARTSEDGFGPYDQMAFGRLAESAMRSINNLLEHFHQSFFFYLLLSTRRFVSIGTYLPSAMFIGASFTISGIASWMRATRSVGGESLVESFAAFGLFVCIVFSSIALFGVVANVPSSQLLPTVAAISAITTFAPTVFLTTCAKRASYLEKLRSYLMIYAGLFLTTLSTINFSLAVVYGLLFAPIQFFVCQSSVPQSGLKFTIGRTCTILALTASCPWLCFLVYYVLFVHGQYLRTFPPSLADLNSLIANFSAAELGNFMYDVVWNWRALGVWGFVPVLFTVWLPMWVGACAIGCTRVEDGVASAVNAKGTKKVIATKIPTDNSTST